ncbi:phage antirepressor KilAC domain-containing protein [Pantoea agglomerans]|uniref:phage antirepressor KilAC domain-containing protein n=1 Tax=Enterobacter agglomerans TaxID=549 RepID=UPI000DACEABF|nr:phage antirepressor KilAC domain-containing protein [Pantoea agglomerans]RAH33233.1 phage regulatory protein/antirepressor Ant [Pantoea agglomerans]TGX93473.1 phage regulatory protein/antirepressor Ant [Pantoea agglomerans]
MLNQSAGAIAPVVNAIQSPIMTSREIADLTGKQHAHVMRDIHSMFRELGVNHEGYLHFWTHPQNGQQYPEFYLDREHTECLITGYSAILRMKVIKRLHELEESQPVKIPQTFAEALRLAAEAEEEKERLQLQLTEAAPKVAFVDRYVTATSSMTFRQVAKLLDAKEPELRLFLIESRVMYRLNGVLTPYSQHIEAGRFEVRTGTTTESNYMFSQSRFTAKGVQWIGGLWTAHKAAGGAE